MTFNSKLPLHLNELFLQLKHKTASLLNKLEVIADSNAIIYSIRILIIVIALLMGYIHSPKNNTDTPNSQHSEIHHQKAVKGQ